MICINCNKDVASVVLDDVVTCPHCNGSVSIEHVVCIDCALMWKSVGGVTTEVLELSGLFEDSDGLSKEESSLINMLREMVEKIPDVTNDCEGLCDKKLSDFVHKCLKCSSVAIEISDGTYRCVSCGFTWSNK